MTDEVAVVCGGAGDASVGEEEEVAGVGLEDSIVEGDAADVGHIGEEGVDVELTHRVGPPAEKVKHLLHGFVKVGIEGVSGGWGGGVERGHSNGGRHFNGGVKVALGEGRVDVGHGRDKVSREVVGFGEDLIANSDGKDSEDRIGIGGDVGRWRRLGAPKL